MKVVPISVDEYNIRMINSIKDKYKDLRQKSKGITFALSYMGTYLTLMENFGFSKEQAKQLEDAYHQLYTISDQWVERNINFAKIHGYVYGAFNLKIRTPQLYRIKPWLSNQWAEKEKRTAANALGQSWGLLNDRAMLGFLLNLPPNCTTILPVAKIHDAQYYLIKDDPETLKFVNDTLIKEIKWQEAPQIAHDSVHLGGELSLFYPTWANESVIPNDSTLDEIKDLIIKAKNEK